MLKLSDYEKAAKETLSSWVNNFYHGVSEEGHTYEQNFRAIQRYLLKPRMLRDVSDMDISTTVLGHKVSFPVCVSPTAAHGHAHDSAEIGSATGAGKSGVIFTLSAFSNQSIEEVAQACPDTCKFFNLYIFSDRELVLRLIRSAKSSGYKALVVTVDAPRAGPGVGKKALLFLEQMKRRPYTYKNLISPELQYKPIQYRTVGKLFNPGATWSDITWLRSVTSLPIIIKGILCGEDAELAVEAGAAGILVSNHGGRQIGSTTGTMDVLREVVFAVRGRCEVYVDGGFRTGSDVLKALALGAQAVFIGRPVLYALANGGAESVEEMFTILREEFKAAMAMSGCARVSDVTSALVRHRSEIPAKL